MDAALNPAYPPRTVRDAKMHRPGFRVPLQSYQDSRAAKMAAYREYEDALVSAHKQHDDVTSAHSNPLGGGGSDDPLSGFGSRGARGSVEGHVCKTNGGAPGHLCRIGDRLVCVADDPQRDAEPDVWPRKKLKRNARGQEGDTEEYERDEKPRLFDEYGNQVGWDDIIRIARQINAEAENDNGDDEEGHTLSEITEALRCTSTHHESTLRDVPDHKTLSKMHQTRMAKLYDADAKALSEAWRKG